MKFKIPKYIKNIYKTFTEDIGFTIKMSGTITVALLIIYLIFALILNQIGSLSYLGTFDYLLAIIGICLVLSLLSPFIYSFFAINGGMHTNARDKIKYTSFLKTYLLGTRPPFSGQLRVWMTLIKALCVEIIFSFIIYLIVYFIAYVPNTELNTILTEVEALLASSSNSDVESLLTALEEVIYNHEAFINSLMIIVNFFPLLFATYYFIHTISRNTFKYYLASSLGAKAPKNVADFIFIKTMRANRKEYNISYYSTMFPVTILFVLAFTLSYFLLGYYGPEAMSYSILNLTAIVISIIVTLPFMPIVFNLHEYLWPHYSMLFMGVFLENAQKELETFKRNNQMAMKVGEENLKQAEGSINKMRENIIQDLKNKGYEDSDFEGLSDQEIFQNIREDESYLPYKRKMERLNKEKETKSETPKESEENKKDDTQSK